MTDQTVVYMKNVNYNTTEEELGAFFEGFKVKKIIIPTHTVVFGSNKRRPLGIAYVDFEDNDEAQKAAKSINGVKLKNRVVHAKLHVPFVPKTKNPKNDDPNSSGENPKLSNDTFYIPYLDVGTTDEQLREFFKVYDPEQICIFTDKRKRHRFFNRGQSCSALVTVKSTKSLGEIRVELKDEKFNQKKLSIWPASNAKIERVAKYVQALAVEEQKNEGDDAPTEPIEMNKTDKIDS